MIQDTKLLSFLRLIAASPSFCEAVCFVFAVMLVRELHETGNLGLSKPQGYGDKGWKKAYCFASVRMWFELPTSLHMSIPNIKRPPFCRLLCWSAFILVCQIWRTLSLMFFGTYKNVAFSHFLLFCFFVFAFIFFVALLHFIKMRFLFFAFL